MLWVLIRSFCGEIRKISTFSDEKNIDTFVGSCVQILSFEIKKQTISTRALIERVTFLYTTYLPL